MERENNMFGIRELKERVAKLEEELGKKTKALESAMDYQDEVAEFLLKHDRNEIVLDYKPQCFELNETHITYVFNGKLKVAKTNSWCNFTTLKSTEDLNGIVEILTIKEHHISEENGLWEVEKYYQLNKAENTLTDITETRKALLKETEKKTTTTKSQNKKGDK